jgi:hypothetical protein
METSTGIIIGKIAFYTALAALVIVLIIKKRKQVKSSEKNSKNTNL